MSAGDTREKRPNLIQCNILVLPRPSKAAIKEKKGKLFCYYLVFILSMRKIMLVWQINRLFENYLEGFIVVHLKMSRFLTFLKHKLVAESF